MADNRKRYIYTVKGVEHTLLLTPDDAEHYGDAVKEAPKTKVTTK